MSRGATRDVRGHEHLGRSIWSSLTITVYYHLVGLGGGVEKGYQALDVRFIILSDRQDWARMGARLRLSSAHHPHLLVDIDIGIS